MAMRIAPRPPAAHRTREFDLRGLSGISDDQIEEHLALYAGYVRQVNALDAELAEMLDRDPVPGKSPELDALSRRRGFEYNGMILHEYYFGALRAAADPAPAAGSALAEALAGAFGSVAKWRAEFEAIGAMRGVGWVILFRDPTTARLANHWITLHQDGVPAGFKPLLVMDVWEHAFMRDYRATERQLYVDAFLRNVDWSTVETRLHEDGVIRHAA